jgi:hypothetical protein
MGNKTAVEWLIDKHFGGIENVTPDFKKHIEQAKEMEKERTIEFCIDWYFNGFPLEGGGGDVEETIEQHYNQTYGDDKQ